MIGVAGNIRIFPFVIGRSVNIGGRLLARVVAHQINPEHPFGMGRDQRENSRKKKRADDDPREDRSQATKADGAVQWHRFDTAAAGGRERIL